MALLHIALCSRQRSVLHNKTPSESIPGSSGMRLGRLLYEGRGFDSAGADDFADRPALGGRAPSRGEGTPNCTAATTNSLLKHRESEPTYAPERATWEKVEDAAFTRPTVSVQLTIRANLETFPITRAQAKTLFGHRLLFERRWFGRSFKLVHRQELIGGRGRDVVASIMKRKMAGLRPAISLW